MVDAEWLELFFKKNSTLCIRKPEGVSTSRAVGMNKEVQKYVKLLTKIQRMSFLTDL